ncbi:hypothetical protein PG985_013233 [Apiospora marii]|uniref:Uncharacterized protein n=1 Tax=Apiospora marii TaxID=335849 RepID=A0ABR1R8S1_9PEZI
MGLSRPLRFFDLLGIVKKLPRAVRALKSWDGVDKEGVKEYGLVWTHSFAKTILRKAEEKLKNFDCVNGSLSNLPIDYFTATGVNFLVLESSEFSVSARQAEEGRFAGYIVPDEDETISYERPNNKHDEEPNSGFGTKPDTAKNPTGAEATGGSSVDAILSKTSANGGSAQCTHPPPVTTPPLPDGDGPDWMREFGNISEEDEMSMDRTLFPDDYGDENEGQGGGQNEG